MKRKAILSAVLSLSLVAAACTDSVSDLVEDLCSDLEVLHDTLAQIAGPEVYADSTTVENVQNAGNEVKSAAEDVQNAETDLSEYTWDGELLSPQTDQPADQRATERCHDLASCLRHSPRSQ